MMWITKARPGDIPAVRSCAAAAYTFYIQRIGRIPAPMTANFEAHLERGELFVAHEETSAVPGFIVFYPRGDHIHVENVAVDPCCQGKGVGGALMRQAEAMAAQYNLSEIEL